MRRRLIPVLLAIVVTGMVVLYFYFSPAGSQGKKYYKILCLGDSLTQSRYGQYPRHLERRLQKAGIRANVYSGGRPGHTSGEYRRFLKESDLLGRIDPDMVIIMLGTNDVRIDGDSTPLAEFMANMEEILRQVKQGNRPSRPARQVFLATIPPIFHCDLATFNEVSQRRVTEEILPAIRRLAKQEGVHLLDVYGFFSGRPELLPGIHPTDKGYAEMAGFISRAIRPFL